MGRVPAGLGQLPTTACEPQQPTVTSRDVLSQTAFPPIPTPEVFGYILQLHLRALYGVILVLRDTTVSKTSTGKNEFQEECGFLLLGSQR